MTSAACPHEHDECSSSCTTAFLQQWPQPSSTLPLSAVTGGGFGPVQHEVHSLKFALKCLHLLFTARRWGCWGRGCNACLSVAEQVGPDSVLCGRWPAACQPKKECCCRLQLATTLLPFLCSLASLAGASMTSPLPASLPGWQEVSEPSSSVPEELLALTDVLLAEDAVPSRRCS